MTSPNAIPIPQDAALRVVRAEWERVKRERDEAHAEVERLRQREAVLLKLLADVETDHARHAMLDPACSSLHGRIMGALAESPTSGGKQGEDGSG